MVTSKTKRCSMCKASKPLSDFYKNRCQKDGYSSHCINCQREYLSSPRGKEIRKRSQAKTRVTLAYREKSRTYKQQWRKTETGQVSEKNSLHNYRESGKKEDWYKKNPLARGVHLKVYWAIKVGLIIRPQQCNRCFRLYKHLLAHHEDYSKPFEIDWLCASCHSFIHGRTAKAV